MTKKISYLCDVCDDGETEAVVSFDIPFSNSGISGNSNNEQLIKTFDLCGNHASDIFHYSTCNMTVSQGKTLIQDFDLEGKGVIT